MFTIHSYKITEKQLLITILLLGALIRFWGLGTAEIFHDEGFYAFRSIGYLDYLQNDDQTTPVQWFRDSDLPRWSSLSFHDHPPFFFWAQNLFFNLFSDSLLISRLPSLLAGLGTVYLTYLLGRRWFNAKIGLLAASLLSINHIHIWISRSGIMESLLTFFIFLNIYIFFKLLDDPQKWLVWGLTLGLAFLTKYTSFFLVSVYLFYLVISRSSLFKNWRFYAALGLALVVFSPILIYNFYLYKTTGHFDLQFAYFFGQETSEWRASIGKIQEPFSNILTNLSAMYSMPFLLAVLGGLICSVLSWKREKNSAIIFSWLTLVFIILLLIPVGSAFRFITLYLFPFLFFAVLLLDYLRTRISINLWIILLAAFILYEIYFTLDGIFFTFPDLGVAKLDSYLEEALGDKRSIRFPKSPNPHLDRIINGYGKKYPPAQESLMIIYDENIALSARLWPITRRLYYHGILAVTAGQFKTMLRNEGPAVFENTRAYFIKATEHTSLNPNFNTLDSTELENFLVQELKLSPEQVIYGQYNQPMFRIYKILL